MTLRSRFHVVDEPTRPSMQQEAENTIAQHHIGDEPADEWYDIEAEYNRLGDVREEQNVAFAEPPSFHELNVGQDEYTDARQDPFDDPHAHFSEGENEPAHPPATARTVMSRR